MAHLGRILGWPRPKAVVLAAGIWGAYAYERAGGWRRDKRMGPAAGTAGRNGPGTRSCPESPGQPGLAAAAAAAEVAIVAAGYFGYAPVRLAVRASRPAAVAHAAGLWRAERWLHLDVEPSLNHLAAARPVLAETRRRRSGRHRPWPACRLRRHEAGCRATAGRRRAGRRLARPGRAGLSPIPPPSCPPGPQARQCSPNGRPSQQDAADSDSPPAVRRNSAF